MSLTLNNFQRRNGIVNLSIFQFCLKTNRMCVNQTFGHKTLGIDVSISREVQRNKTIMEKIDNLVDYIRNFPI